MGGVMGQLTSVVSQDAITEAISSAFDFSFDGRTEFTPPEFSLPESYGIGLIVGPSGSGKSTLLRGIGASDSLPWDASMAIASHFASSDDAIERLGAVGLNSIPAWLRPYDALSTGEKFRADLAIRIKDGAAIDEFTSVVDRNVARACSVALRRFVDAKGVRNLTLASCHYDIIEWLQPDWHFDTATGELVERGALQRRPKIDIQIIPCDASAWAMFHRHHYLSAAINKSSRCWLALWGDTPVGFASAIAFPNGNLMRAWREHRTVVLPDYQGLGIGVRLSDAIAAMFVADGCRYFSKTAHPRMGGYREASPLWRGTSKNRRARLDYNPSHRTKEDGHKAAHMHRVCYSHEYVGLAA